MKLDRANYLGLILDADFAPIMTEILIRNKQEMVDFASKMAKSAIKNQIIGLKGTLGSGKSFFAANFINTLLTKKTEVLSPTFNLVYSYQTNKGEVFHFDLYRLKNVNELENIGFFEALKSGICLIEWPEIASSYLTKNYLEIEIKSVGDNYEEEKRLISISNLPE